MIREYSRSVTCVLLHVRSVYPISPFSGCIVNSLDYQIKKERKAIENPDTAMSSQAQALHRESVLYCADGHRLWCQLRGTGFESWLCSFTVE